MTELIKCKGCGYGFHKSVIFNFDFSIPKLSNICVFCADGLLAIGGLRPWLYMIGNTGKGFARNTEILGTEQIAEIDRYIAATGRIEELMEEAIKSFRKSISNSGIELLSKETE